MDTDLLYSTVLYCIQRGDITIIPENDWRERSHSSSNDQDQPSTVFNHSCYVNCLSHHRHHIVVTLLTHLSTSLPAEFPSFWCKELTRNKCKISPHSPSQVLTHMFSKFRDAYLSQAFVLPVFLRIKWNTVNKNNGSTPLSSSSNTQANL